MKIQTGFTIGLLACTLSACGGHSVIDEAKDAYLPQCPGQSLSKIVNGYFINDFDAKTLWAAYGTDDPDTVRVTAEGEILYVGVNTAAALEVLYDQARDELSLSGVKFGGKDQSQPYAEALASNMWDKAKGL
ncbi:MAG: hypothetical protein KDA56_02045 [Hyphomonas sp.]|nr:hypothetical protein [Hyphomonas sp.]